MHDLTTFAVNHWMLVTVFFVLIGALIATSFGAVTGMTPLDAVKLINREDALVLDIRNAKDFAAGHVIDAVNLPLADVDKAGERLKKHLGKPILVCCAGGNLAGQAVASLKQQGFERVHALRGGISAWRADNLPLTGA